MKKKIRKRAFKFIGQFGENIPAKFTNICSKTGQYDVPDELFQKRTSRKNRVLISWDAVKSNNLSYDQLNTFEGGVVVAFVNNDFFDPENQSNELFQALNKKIGGDDNVSAIISIKSEAGSSSSAVQREAFQKLVNNSKVYYKGNEIIVNPDNYMDYAIKQDIKGRGYGNDVWSGFLYVSIRGGQQDKIETHSDQELTLFNPACEYASQDVCEDINLVMSYYAMISIDKTKLLDADMLNEYHSIMDELKATLRTIHYKCDGNYDSLFDYVNSQYSVSLYPGQLTDPIQLTPITIDKFNLSHRTEDSIDFTHEEAVIHERYYWDEDRNCILSPARPTNTFWSFHLSNMMQQNYTLDDYFDYEEKRFKKRQELISKRVE